MLVSHQRYDNQEAVLEEKVESVKWVIESLYSFP